MRKRPWTVAVVAWIFILVGVAGLAAHAGEMKPHPPFAYDVLWPLGAAIVAAVCGFFLLRGSDWARWLALAWLVFHVVLSAFHSRQELIVHAVLLAIFAYLLFRPEASRYFRPATPAGN
jgi:uncharacterized membrane protein